MQKSNHFTTLHMMGFSNLNMVGAWFVFLKQTFLKHKK